MRVVALCSGGKDSCYSMQLCRQHGHDVVALANLLPEDTAPDELDSFCFQTVGHQLVGEYAACMGVPLFRKRISGTSSVQDLGYSPTDGDEVEDLFQLLAFVKDSVPGIQAVASGAIASDYQRLRVENVCSRLNLVSLAYLWHQPQRMLLRGMIECGIEAILVKVACLGLHPRKHLGRSIAAMEPTLLALADAYGCNVCGEGGEYETLTLDCPMFVRGRIELQDFEVVYGSGDVGYLAPKSFRVVPKPGWEGGDLPSDVRHVPADYVTAPRFSRCSAGPALPPSPPPGALCNGGSHGSPAGSAGAAAAAYLSSPIASSVSGTSGASSPSSASAADSLLLQPAAPSSFTVQVSMCSGPDYVQLVCRAVRSKSSLPSDITECDTTAALHALLTTAEQELAVQHMDLHHCLFVHLFLANMGHFQAANGVYCKHFPGRDPPSRACVQVCLPHDCPVMCEFLLARGSAPPATRSPLPPPSPVTRHTRRVLHVQSISSWAPSCIGPYSQATSYRGLVYLAGVIPLDPPVMTLVPGDITAQVLRAMTSCEAVAVAQRTTVVGAALGLTVYLAAGLGGSSGGGGGGGALCGCSVERSQGSSGGAELRALTRAAVEALLDHGLPGHPPASHRHSGLVPSNPPSAGRYHRSSTCESSSGGGYGGLGTPRGSTMPGMMQPSLNGISAPGSRRSVVLGADGLDEEEEEHAAMLARATVSGGGGGGLPSGCGHPSGMAAAVLDPYLQPPEVRNTVRPSVLYVTVPSLPRGSLVEIQPVCLDVEALAVIRRLTGHESFMKRRNSSHHDAASLHHQAQQHGSSATQPGHSHSHHHHHGHAPFLGSPIPSATGTTTWSELPRTPRGSMESIHGYRELLAAGAFPSGGCGTGLPAGVTHGSVPGLPWLQSGEVVLPGGSAGGGPPGVALPSHLMMSAAGFMSPDTGGSLVGTPSAGPSLLWRQRSSGLGLVGSSGGGAATLAAVAAAGGSNSSSGGGHVFNRCGSPGPGYGSLPGVGSGHGTGMGAGLGLHVQVPPPPSAHGSGHQLLSPTLANLLQLQMPQTPSPSTEPTAAAGGLPPPAPGLPPQAPLSHQNSQQPAGGSGGSTSSGAASGGGPTSAAAASLRQRLSSSNGGFGARDQSSAAASAAISMARASYSGSSGSSSGPLMPRSSLDGNILSFEVSSGRRMSSTCLAASPLPAPSPSLPAGLSLTLSPVAAVGLGTGGSLSSPSAAAGGTVSSGAAAAATHPPPVRHRPAAISVPQASSLPGCTPVQGSPFESVPASAAAMQVAQAEATAAAMAAAAASHPPSAPSLRVSAPAPPVRLLSGVSSQGTSTPGSGHAAAGVPPNFDGPIGEAAAAAAPPPPPPAGPSAHGSHGGSSSSDVMVTTVCCYGQVLRSLFHLPPAVFAPGVTTAQLTRRFRRAAASVLAAHGMDMSCLIWVRVWYEKGSVGITDDEFGFSPATCTAGAAATGPLGAAAAAASGGPCGQVLHALDDDLPDAAKGGGKPGRMRRGSGSGDSSGGGGPSRSAVASAAAVLGNGPSAGCGSPRTATAAGRAVAGCGLSPGLLAVIADGGAGGGSPDRVASPAPQSPASAAGTAGPLSPTGKSPSVGVPRQEGAAAGSPCCHPHHLAHHHHHHQQQQQSPLQAQQQQQHFHVAWVPVQRVATNATPQPVSCVGVLELLAALPSP